MPQPGSIPSLGDAQRRAWPVLLGAFSASPFIYMGLGWFLRRGASVTPVLPSALRWILFCCALAAFGACLLWVRLRLSGSGAPGDSTTSPIAPSDFQAAMIVACALGEIPAILGLILAFLGAPLTDLYLLGGLSIVAVGGVVAPAVVRYLGTLGSSGPVQPGS